MKGWLDISSSKPQVAVAVVVVAAVAVYSTLQPLLCARLLVWRVLLIELRWVVVGITKKAFLLY